MSTPATPTPPRPPQPLSADALQLAFAEACRVHAAGRLEEARAQYRSLLGYLPESALLHYNVGLVCYALREFDQALLAFSQAATYGPEDADTLFNLALCQKKTGDHPAAIATYLQILAASPDHVDSLYNLGGCYSAVHDEVRAMDCYHRVLTVQPGYHPAANNLAYLYHRAGEIDQAIHYYSQVLELRPEDESVRHMLASLLGVTPEHAPDAYVRDFFDAYAEGFEHSLVEELGYDNPRRLCECLCKSGAQPAVYAHGLDLGCGTGLSGLSFKALITVLDGVDLSRQMLAQAAQKGCYAVLHPDSILHYLDATAETYDFFLATDVFIYVGELLDVFNSAHAVARPQALFCFSTEHLDAGGYQLMQTGRFAYSHAYIRRIAAATGWIVLALEPTQLRKERETWIAGDLWVFQLDPAIA
jgi:predicted TPR repeat methyltransferase